MGPGAFVYCELQLSAAAEQPPWRELSRAFEGQPGLSNTTWLSGAGNRSLGSLHAFDNLDHARAFVNSTLRLQAQKLGVAQTSRLFDGAVVRDASRDMNSVYWGPKLGGPPGAFVYTELQLSVPFSRVQWRERNPILRANPGFLAKTWLSGVGSESVGGFYAFDSVEHAKRFAVEVFASRAADLGVGVYTRVFDASATEKLNRDSGSPFY